MTALGNLLRRYVGAFRASWAMRREMRSPDRLKHELEFLPAGLELAETPVHPAPRWTMISISLLAIAAVAVGTLGRLDIVVVAKGKLLPVAQVKVIQPAVTGVVRKILVDDGQRVAAGQVLLELDLRQAKADSTKASSARTAASLAAARAEILLAAQRSAKLADFPAIAAATPEQQQESSRLAQGIYNEYRDKIASAEAELARRAAELQTTEREIEKLASTAPLVRQQAEQFSALVDKKYVTKTDYLQKEQAALEQEHELVAQRSHASELRAAIAQQRATVAAVTSQFRREQLDALAKAKEDQLQNGEDETKAQTREDLMTLRSPVAGTVQQLNVHTLGAVVSTAQSLMEIVPDDKMDVEATIENKDIGFVREGQEAIVKIDSFPYSRYGYLHGVVRYVSNNAVPDKKLGSAFASRIQLSTNKMLIDGRTVSLTPGMAVVAEVKTGRRSVAGYFLDPLLHLSNESLRER